MTSQVYKGSFAKKRKTETAGTEILQLIEPSMKGARTRITSLVYTSLGTAHTISILKALNRTTLTAAAAATDTAVTVASASFLNQTIAANDYIVIRHTDGTFGAYKVSAIASLTLTIPALAAAAGVGALVWIMGAIGEAEHVQIAPPVSAQTRYADENGIAVTGYRSVYSSTVYSRSGNDDPLLIHSGNATAAGVIESVAGSYGSP
jgi:hypothetical protein